MYINKTAHIIRKVFRQKEKLNILCAPTHERFEGNLAKTGHQFYGLRGPHIKDWKECYHPIPSNYTVFNINLKDEQVPPHLVFDLVLSQNKFGQFQMLAPIANALDIPLVSLEHTAYMPFWDQKMKEQVHSMRGTRNVFITEWSLKSWDWKVDPTTVVIPHAVDASIFDKGQAERKNHILVVGNDYIGRDGVLNFSQYKRVVLDNKLPTRAVGDTPGLSLPAKDVYDLVNEYQTSRIFLNTHHISPMPMSLLEGMACGCACVSINASAVSSYIEHGKNGFLYNTDQEAYEYVTMLLNDEGLSKKFGEEAINTIKEKCNLNRFIQQWNKVFYESLDIN